ncbi:hypothetical protein ABUK73_15195 [Agrobacterium sp. BA1120]|uniref:hypothetical protein n=1 Tax=Agrobacterium sp. BA1120 TaxID=3228927 RepID=UPI00336A9C69
MISSWDWTSESERATGRSAWTTWQWKRTQADRHRTSQKMRRHLADADYRERLTPPADSHTSVEHLREKALDKKNKLDMDFTPKQLMQDIREHDTRGSMPQQT